MIIGTVLPSAVARSPGHEDVRGPDVVPASARRRHPRGEMRVERHQRVLTPSTARVTHPLFMPSKKTMYQEGRSFGVQVDLEERARIRQRLLAVVGSRGRSGRRAVGCTPPWREQALL